MVAAIGGVVLGGGWWWWLVSVVAGVGGVLVVPPGNPPAYSQPDTLAGARKALQCGGALACESKFSGQV